MSYPPFPKHDRLKIYLAALKSLIRTDGDRSELDRIIKEAESKR